MIRRFGRYGKLTKTQKGIAWVVGSMLGIALGAGAVFTLALII